MVRLPTPGSDDGVWGGVLNDYLAQSHDNLGALKPQAVVAAGAYVKPGAGIPEADLENAVIVKLNATAPTVNGIAPVNGNVTLTAANVFAVPLSQKGTTSGVATLDSNGLLTAAQLPANAISKSTNINDTGRAIDAYTGAPLTLPSSGSGSSAGLTVAAIALTSAMLAAGKYTPVNAASGVLTMTLPSGSAGGTLIALEKTDTSSNVVTISGSIRGATSALSLVLPKEALELIADSAGSWWPLAGHKTLSSLDTRYAASILLLPVTTNFTIAATDAGKQYRSAVVAAVVVTIPLNASDAIPIGSQFSLMRAGTGAYVVSPAAGVTLISVYGYTTLARQGSSATLTKVDTDTWDLVGDLA